MVILQLVGLGCFLYHNKNWITRIPGSELEHSLIDLLKCIKTFWCVESVCYSPQYLWCSGQEIKNCKKKKVYFFRRN